MRLALGLALGALLGAARAGEVVARQQTNPTPTASPPPSPSPSSAPTSASTDSPSDSSTPSSPSTPSTSAAGDVTVISTVFATNDKAPAFTTTTTVITTVTSVVVVTATVITTTTVTSRDQDTSTSTVYKLSTQVVDMRKRSVDDATLSTSAAAPAHVDAAVTGALDNEPRHALAKRATFTRTTTVVVGNDNSQSTEVRTATRTVTTRVTSQITTTSVITETNQANAKTVVTVTSPLVITSTRVSTDLETSTPTEGGSGGRGGSSSNGSGLSTGAKAGIGVGAALGGLAVLGVLAVLLVRRRRSPKPDHDDFMGASEVPVGGPAGGASGSVGPMSDTTSAGGHLAPGRSHSGRAEGYRGTAMGDGRAGYAKPTPYGSAYTSTPSTTVTRHNQNTSPAADQLPRHPTPGESSVVSPTTSDTVELGSGGAAATKWYNADAAEIDSQPVMSHQSGPVYEMPTEPYR